MSKPIVYFGPHREPAVLVERFEELREGMIVWRAAPGKTPRRKMLMDLEPIHCTNCLAFGMWTGAEPVTMASDVRLKAPTRLGCICRCGVAEKTVYAVILEPPAKTETRETSKPRKLEKV